MGMIHSDGSIDGTFWMLPCPEYGCIGGFGHPPGSSTEHESHSFIFIPDLFVMVFFHILGSQTRLNSVEVLNRVINSLQSARELPKGDRVHAAEYVSCHLALTTELWLIWEPRIFHLDRPRSFTWVSNESYRSRKRRGSTEEIQYPVRHTQEMLAKSLRGMRF